MQTSKLGKIYNALAFVSVFTGVLKRPIFQAFFNYCEVPKTENFQKRRAYAAFVSEIYNHGGCLTELVQKYVFEDENVYVKSFAKDEKVNDNVETAALNELYVFSVFASLTATDFAEDMGEEEVPKFTAFNTDMVASYKERMGRIHQYGYGIFSSCGMFRLTHEKEIVPIVSADKISMDNFIGYQEERQRVVDNTKMFIEGRPAANVLLCGDAGTGKSSTVKAVANTFYNDGVRLIELRKDQLRYLPSVMGKISGNPLKFIIFIDDLSFNQNDDNFSMLKAALEGSASAKADNAVIYATSNRRHIIKESFGDREGDDVHRNDTLQETLSLSERFGLTVLFSKPSKALYLEIVKQLAQRNGVEMDEATLFIKAEEFAIRKGNRSARCAEQFVKSLM